MARRKETINSDTQLKKASSVGLHAIRGQAGLSLQIRTNGQKSFVYRYMIDGKARKLGLGGFPKTSLAQAKVEANKLRGQINEGRDPIAIKQAKKQAKSRAKTFQDCALLYIELNEAEWRNPKHRQQWRNTLRDYAYPVFGDQDISSITRDQVLKVLQPLWAEKPETGRRLRQRIETVFDFARATKVYSGENPARWKGELELILPNTRKVKPVQHLRSLPYAAIPQFWTDLGQEDSLSALAMRLLLLCANRTGEVLKAEWSEFDLKKKNWVIPSHRMKAGIEHVIPLSSEAIKVIESIPRLDDRWVFPAQRGDGHLSDMSLLMLLRRMDYDSKTTTHGLRATFRTYISEETNYPHRLAEYALAHELTNDTEKAYARGKAIERRRELMEHWANYCSYSSHASNVTAIKRASS